MKITVEPLVIETIEGMIHITQPCHYTDPVPISISPEQVPHLIGWLEQAAKEIKETEKKE